MTVVARQPCRFGDERLPARFWAKVMQRPCAAPGLMRECWTWYGSRTSKGYGSFYLGKDRHGRQRTGVAHKMTFELAHGRVPKRRGGASKRLVIDHKCRNRACVNPAHHELVVEPVNVRRGESPAARHARKTHCPRGHAYDEKNTYVLRIRHAGRDTIKRYCRTCRSTRA